MRQTIDKRILRGLDAHFYEEETNLILDAKKQIKEYFEGNRVKFDIPLLTIGTAFQKNVWDELLKIPYGKTETYSGLSRKVSSVKAIRAVAAANGANAIVIIIPCHRVIGSNGEMAGHAGGVRSKKRLLQLESGDRMVQKELPFREALP